MKPQEKKSQNINRSSDARFFEEGDAYKKILRADLDVFNHNIETVPRLYTKVRPGARYFASLDLLKNAKKFKNKVFTKSGIMVGLGENKDEVVQVMDDLRSAEVDFITIGQYLQPSRNIILYQDIILQKNSKSLRDIRKDKRFFTSILVTFNKIFISC